METIVQNITQLLAINDARPGAQVWVSDENQAYTACPPGTPGALAGRNCGWTSGEVPEIIVNSTDPAKLQAALDSAPATGANIRLGPGTWNLTQYLHCFGKNNIKIVGAGMGSTIIDGSAISSRTAGVNWAGYGGLIGISGGAAGVYASKCGLQDLTIIDSSDSPYDGQDPRVAHNICANNVKDFSLLRVELIGGQGEVVVLDTGSTDFNENISVKDCVFKDTLTASGSSTHFRALWSLNTRSERNKGLEVTGCLFSEIYGGCLLLGEDLNVHHNRFHRVQRNGIIFGESEGVTDRPTVIGALASHNTFSQLGYANDHTVMTIDSVGIATNTRELTFLDGRHDSGIVIDNNTFIDSIADGSSVIGVMATSGAVVRNNEFGNFLGTADHATRYAILWRGVSEANLSTLRLSGNRAPLPAGSSIVWSGGVMVDPRDNVRVQFEGGNDIGAGLAVYLTNNGSGQPSFAFNGDKLSGYLKLTPGGLLNVDGALNGAAFYGSSDTQITCQVT